MSSHFNGTQTSTEAFGIEIGKKKKKVRLKMAAIFNCF